MQDHKAGVWNDAATSALKDPLCKALVMADHQLPWPVSASSCFRPDLLDRNFCMQQEENYQGIDFAQPRP